MALVGTTGAVESLSLLEVGTLLSHARVFKILTRLGRHETLLTPVERARSATSHSMMPPRKKAPAGRVYKSTIPLKQTKLPPPEQRIRSYGKSTSKRIPKPDNTLTQMDFVNLNRPILSDEDESDDLYAAEPVEKPEPFEAKRQRRRAMLEDDEDGDGYMKEAEKQKKRRRTPGGEDEQLNKRDANKGRRRTACDELSSTPKYHTQTLTQMESFSSWASPPSVQGEEAELQRMHYDVSPSSHILKLHQKAASKQDKQPSNPSPQPGSDNSMPPPQTPSRGPGLEIPSSQSPMTPFSARAIRNVKRTPLDERDLNAPIPFSTTPKRRKLIVRDTFSTASRSEDSQHSCITTSPSKRSSPAKSVRFADQEDTQQDIMEQRYAEHNAEEQEEEEEEERRRGEEEEEEEGEEEYEEVEAESDELENKLEVSPTVKSEPAPSQHPVSQRSLSQARSNGEILDSDAESDSNDEEFKPDPEQEENSGADAELNLPGEEPETFYGNIGLETQREADQLLTAHKSSSPFEESQIPGDEKNQYMESQRISRKQAALMRPRTTDSDIFISLSPHLIKNIVKRKSDHVFRRGALPPTVVRWWIYETAPKSRIKYMAVIGPVKRPGDNLDEEGLRSASSNNELACSAACAYEILDLYELANTRKLAECKELGWFKQPPQMVWVRPAVLDDLMGNLKPPIFTRLPLEKSQSPPSMDTQDAEAQLFSNIQQFTQPTTSGQASSTPVEEDEEDEFTYNTNDLPSTDTQPQNPSNCRDRPSQAETVDSSQSGTPRHHALPDVIWESPTRPVPSSTPQLPTPFAKPASVRSESIVPFSMGSSQFLTKSQMLPDSLLKDSIPTPPDFIQDSEDEE